MSRIILARHGNTFRPEDTPVWVGARSDLPLVDKGLAQAEALAAALLAHKVQLAALTTGPLQRTRKTAEIVAERLGIAPDRIRIDNRLTEIDYGRWEGKTTDEIMAMDPNGELQDWNKNSVYPSHAGWKPKEMQIIADVGLLMAEALPGTSLIVTSNGILRFFAAACANADEIADRKVATGHICVLEGTPDSGWRIIQWNQPPERLSV